MQNPVDLSLNLEAISMSCDEIAIRHLGNSITKLLIQSGLELSLIELSNTCSSPFLL